MRIILFLFLILLNSYSFPQEIDRNIKDFFEDLIANSEDLSKYLDKSELDRSQRLDINYEGIKNKFLISFDVDDSIKNEIKRDKISYQLEEEKHDKGFTKVTFLVPSRNYSKEFYFKDDKLVSPAFYFCSGWKNFQTKYFDFFISDPSLFNDYSAKALENYISTMAGLLQLDVGQKKILEEKKIIYILCRDEDEIKKLTGFATRGIYILAYDEIITTYNCHFHELAHLLINFKLKTLPLHTLPFFQEGFAVAAGGRGGLSRNVLFDAGYFLQKSGIIRFNSILTKDDFLSEDASMTYPVAGLYSLFLLNQYGIESYLKLYRKYSGTENFTTGIEVNSLMLPPADKFEKFTDSLKSSGLISIDIPNKKSKIISEGSSYSIGRMDEYFTISLRRNILFTPSNKLKGYKSKKFTEAFPEIKYIGEKYLITASSREIDVYNLYTNVLIASYTAGFTLDNKEVPSAGGFFKFMIRKDVFDEELESLSASSL
ncbi:MAG TPA: hypothetical protein VMT35_16190 [Ignavibacteriaceae bacterium]|nr:hypothetical protein [Ignavibacteriaceae bacterium]